MDLPKARPCALTPAAAPSRGGGLRSPDAAEADACGTGTVSRDLPGLHHSTAWKVGSIAPNASSEKSRPKNQILSFTAARRRAAPPQQARKILATSLDFYAAANAGHRQAPERARMPAKCQTRHPTAATTWAAFLGLPDIYQRSVDMKIIKHHAEIKFGKSTSAGKKQQHLVA